MNRESLYGASDDDDDDEEDDIGDDLDDLRRACTVTDEITAKPDSIGGGGGGIPSDSEKEDDFEMLRNIKTQLASSTNVSSGPPSDSESEDDFEMLRIIKSQLALSMDNTCVASMGLSDDEDEDDALETLRAIRRRFSAYKNFDAEGSFMNDSPRKKKQVLASDNEPSSEILSRSNTYESFPDHGKSIVTVPESGELQAGHSDDVREKTALEPLDQMETCQSSLLPAAGSSFPESAQAFVDAIRRNRSYQKFLRGKLSEIEATIEKNEKHKKNVKIVKDFQASCKRITKQALSQRKDPRVELISARKSGTPDSSEGNDIKTSPSTLGPLQNSCVAHYKMALEKYPVSVDRRNWSTEENENLAKGLKQQVQETFLFEAIDRSSGSEGPAGDINSILESIKKLEITPEMIRQFLPKVNWDQLALKDRSAAECEARWMSSEDPLINHGDWTAAEEKTLLLIIQKKSFTDWLDIAVSLGTNRTPFQCLARYQRSLNRDILRREWTTAEEDDQLCAAVDLFGENDWQSVATLLEGRTGKQCSERWRNTLHPTRKKVGRFSSEEDKRLKVAVTLFGAKNWHKIAQFVPGRTQVQCRERWANSLDPRINRGKWTKEEDEKLKEAIKEHGNSWAKVATHLSSHMSSHMSCRTDNQCSRRWYSLYPHLVPLKQKANRLRREAMVCNFVDREAERPALAADDFLALPEISIEPEPEVVAEKKKRKARQKKSDAECESEASCVATKRQSKRRRKGLDQGESEAPCVATKRQSKRRRKGLDQCSRDVCRLEDETVCETDSNNGGEVELLEWHSEIQDNVKERQRRPRRKSVAKTLDNSSVITNCSQVKTGNKKLKPRRKVSAVVPSENQDAPN